MKNSESYFPFFSYDLAQMGLPPSVLLFVDPILQNKIYMSQFSIYSKICPYNLCGNTKPQLATFWDCMPNMGLASANTTSILHNNPRKYQSTMKKLTELVNGQLELYSGAIISSWPAEQTSQNQAKQPGKKESLSWLKDCTSSIPGTVHPTLGW